MTESSFLSVVGLSVADDPSCAIWKKNLDILNANNGRQSWSESGMSFRCKYHPEKCEQIDCVGMFRNAMVSVNKSTLWGCSGK